jgi:putative tryptophan/tyrosine transport system substrate-binding protein
MKRTSLPLLGRREFIAGLGGAAAWPLVARAQQGDRVRRIGVLMWGDENDPLQKARLSAFTQALADLGWTDGRNVRIDVRRYGGDINRMRALAKELVGLQRDIIVADATPATAALGRETRTIPIVFAIGFDPVTSGIVERLDRPGGNITGFADYDATLGGKWLELLSEIAPGLKRAAIRRPTAVPRTSWRGRTACCGSKVATAAMLAELRARRFLKVNAHMRTRRENDRLDADHPA